MGKYRNFQTRGGQITLDIDSAMIAAVAAQEKKLRELTDSSEVFCKVDGNHEVSIFAKALNEYRVVGKFSMVQMHGCCGVVISYHSSIDQNFKRRGLGTLFLNIRLDAARRAGYSLIIATVLENNEVETKMLKTSGWTQGETFKNHKTYNKVTFWSLPIVYDD